MEYPHANGPGFHLTSQTQSMPNGGEIETSRTTVKEIPTREGGRDRGFMDWERGQHVKCK